MPDNALTPIGDIHIMHDIYRDVEGIIYYIQCWHYLFCLAILRNTIYLPRRDNNFVFERIYWLCRLGETIVESPIIGEMRRNIVAPRRV